MDWGVAARFSVIIIAIFAAAMLAVFVFDAVWARSGAGAAIVLLAIALYLVKRRSDKKSAQARAGWERSS